MRRLLFLLMVLLVGCGAPPDDGLPRVEAALANLLATLALTTGDVQLKRAGQDQWETGATANVLSAGDWVRTGRGALARVEFIGGGALELDEEAVVVIEALEPVEKKEADLPDSLPLVAVRSGSVRTTLTGNKGESRPIFLRASDGSRARVERKRGTTQAEARVASVKGQTEVSAVSGELAVTAAKKEDLVTTGQVAVLDKSGARTEAMLASPALDAPNPDQRLVLGSTRFDWQPVSGASQYRFQLSRDPSFRKPTRTEELATPGFEFDATVGTWWWRVAARDEGGRQSRWAVRRVFIEKERPADLLRAPDEGASYGYSDGPPRIAFQWGTKGDARTWRLVISRQRDLLANPVVSELVNEPTARVDSLQVGEYFWGVFAQGAELEPLFVTPRRLVVKKVKGAVVAPKRIRKWGP